MTDQTAIESFMGILLTASIIGLSVYIVIKGLEDISENLKKYWNVK